MGADGATSREGAAESRRRRMRRGAGGRGGGKEGHILACARGNIQRVYPELGDESNPLPTWRLGSLPKIKRILEDVWYPRAWSRVPLLCISNDHRRSPAPRAAPARPIDCGGARAGRIACKQKEYGCVTRCYVSGASRARRHGRKSALDIFTVAVHGFNVELSIGHQSAVSADSRGPRDTRAFALRLSFTPTGHTSPRYRSTAHTMQIAPDHTLTYTV
ncbi:unnamed protein product, partial [Brenthis ino]